MNQNNEDRQLSVFEIDANDDETDVVFLEQASSIIRKPTVKDVENIYNKHLTTHGFSGMLGSIDCMHWEWKNCLVSWQGQYGANNDINVLDNSPLFDDLLNDTAPVVPYVGKDALVKLCWAERIWLREEGMVASGFATSYVASPLPSQYTKKIKEQDDLIDTMSDQLAELKNTVKIQQTTISEQKECLRKKDSENEHLKSKIFDFTTVQNLRAQVKELQSENEHLKSKVVVCTMCQNLQVQVEKLKSENEDLKLSVKKLTKAREIVETTLRERDEMVFAQCEKIRLLEEQCEPFYEVHSEFDSEIVLDTQDNSEKDLILSLQTQVKETAELVVRFSDEKYFALKEIESLKDEIKSLQTKNKVLKSGEYELSEKINQMKSQVSELLEKLQISNQEMKQQIVIFEEDK
ncbi:reverse transcriptase domain-containing protein [Tanacetum coccineum]